MVIGDNGPRYQLAISHVVMATDIDTEFVTALHLSTKELLVLELQLTSFQNATFMSVQVSWSVLLT